MNALRNLSQTGMHLAQSTTRLSTGLRINSAADDPSGLIASESYRAQLGSIDQALRNNQDAINYAKTAEGGLDEISRLLREARSLAVANGSSTLDSSQKQANQNQVNNILASINRIAGNTQYGTKKLLDGSAGISSAVTNAAAINSAAFSGTFNGAAMTVDGGVNVQVTTAAARASHTGTQTYATGATTTGAGSFTINGVTLTNDAATTAAETVAKINDASAQTGVTATHTDTQGIVLSSVDYGSDAEINLTDSAGIIQSSAGAVTATGTDAVASVTYNGDTVTFNQGKGLELKDADGNSVKLTVGGNTTATYTSAVQVTAGSSTFQIGANAGQTASLSLGNFNASSLGVATLDISGTDMTAALNSIDGAIESLNVSRGNIGSFVRNTLESNVRSLSVARENLAATESSVREIDVAEEMTNFTKLQILQQSGLSMLAQANSSPQAVLSLLR